MTLDEIKVHVRHEVARGDSLDTYLSDYVNEAIREIARGTDFRFLRATSSLTTSTASRSVTLPATCGDIVSLHWKDETTGGNEPTRPLYERTIAELRGAYDEASEGTPRDYIRRPKVNDTAAETLDIWPAPDDDYALLLEYLSFFATLSTGTGTGSKNVLTVDYPWLVIYRTKQRCGFAAGDMGMASEAQAQYAEQLRITFESEQANYVGPPPPMRWSTGAKVSPYHED